MATTRRRAGRAARRPDFDRLAVEAARSELLEPRLHTGAVEALAAADPQREDDRETRRLRSAFERDAASAQRLVVADLKRRFRTTAGPPVLADMHIPARDLFHVYGPDAAGTGAPGTYSLTLAEVEGGPGTGQDARADHRTGRFWASHYSVSGWRTAFAGVGFRLTPTLAACWLSLRPYVPWTGSDILYHRVFDPQLGERRWAVAMGQIGVMIDSWKLDGSGYRRDGINWIRQWDRRETNPSGGRDHSGTSGSHEGLRLDVPATNARQYALWTVCRADVWGDPGFAVATMASSSISCEARFMVCDEVPL